MTETEMCRKHGGNTKTQKCIEHQNRCKTRVDKGKNMKTRKLQKSEGCKTKTRIWGPELNSTNVSSGNETRRKKTLKKKKKKKTMNEVLFKGIQFYSVLFKGIALDKGKIMRGKVGKTKNFRKQ